MIGVAVLGSTGSVGARTRDVLARPPERVSLGAIAAHPQAAPHAQPVQIGRAHL